MRLQDATTRLNRTGRAGAPAFTLVELLVALALTSILLTMIAQIFFRAGKTVGTARASIETHQNARAALDTMLRDFAAARMCNYANRVGYFALTRDSAGNPVITFTTLAAQPGATVLVPGVNSQYALVRYSLEASGKPVQTEKNQQPRQVYYLVKKVRFPQLAGTFVDMNEFDPTRVPDEAVTSDVLALGILSMNVRFLYGPLPSDGALNPVTTTPVVYYHYLADFGTASGNSAFTVVDATKAWPSDTFKENSTLRLLSWKGSNLAILPSGNSANTVSFVSASASGLIYPSYRVERFRTLGLLSSGINVSVTEGSNTVTASTPTWPDQSIVNAVFIGKDYIPHAIKARPDTSHLTLASAYTGAGGMANGDAYFIFDRNYVAAPTWLSIDSGAMWPSLGSVRPAGLVIEGLPPSEMNASQKVRMPSMVEVSLEMTDRFGTRVFTFTERFFIPAATAPY